MHLLLQPMVFSSLKYPNPKCSQYRLLSKAIIIPYPHVSPTGSQLILGKNILYLMPSVCHSVSFYFLYPSYYYNSLPLFLSMLVLSIISLPYPCVNYHIMLLFNLCKLLRSRAIVSILFPTEHHLDLQE